MFSACFFAWSALSTGTAISLRGHGAGKRVRTLLLQPLAEIVPYEDTPGKSNDQEQN
jgi:hypothetical protein